MYRDVFHVLYKNYDLTLITKILKAYININIFLRRQADRGLCGVNFLVLP